MFFGRSYYLRDPSLVYTYSPDDLLQKKTIVDCGPAAFDFFYADGSPYDPAIFTETRDSDPRTISVIQTDEVILAAEYEFTFIAYFEQYTSNTVQKTEPFTIELIDPCVAPFGLLPPAEGIEDVVVEYTITLAPVQFSFGPFRQDPDWCIISYDFAVEKPRVEPVVTDFDQEERTFTFEYLDDIAPLNDDFEVEFEDIKVTILA